MRRIIFVSLLTLTLSSCVTVSITHTSINSPYSGSISLSSPPGTTQIWDNGSTSSTLSALNASNTPHTANIYPPNTLPGFHYGLGEQYVLCNVAWQIATSNGYLTTGSNGSIQLSNSATGIYSSGAYSKNNLNSAKDGFIEFRVGNVQGNYAIGYAPSYTSTRPTSIKYGLLFSRGWVYIIDNMCNFCNAIQICPYRPGDIFQIIKAGNKVSFTKGYMGFTSHICNISSPSAYIVDAVFSTPGVNFDYVRTSFSDDYDFNSYATLSENLDGSFIEAHKSLNFKYNEKYYSPTLSCNISDNSGTSYSPTIYNNKNGINYHSINLTAAGLTPDKLYILVVTNAKGEKYKLKFKYKNN